MTIMPDHELECELRAAAKRIEAGDFNAARRWLERIADDPRAPVDVRDRAARAAASLLDWDLVCALAILEPDDGAPRGTA